MPSLTYQASGKIGGIDKSVDITVASYWEHWELQYKLV